MPWSRDLIANTREMIQEYVVTPSDALPLKNIHGPYGIIRVDDIDEESFIVTDRDTGKETQYASISKVIAAGWAVD